MRTIEEQIAEQAEVSREIAELTGAGAEVARIAAVQWVAFRENAMSAFGAAPLGKAGEFMAARVALQSWLDAKARREAA